jgi:lincosamide nucleotidyltransferase A/C/D/E
MDATEVLRVLAVLDAAGLRAGLTGGWGVDALLRRQTRLHGDADLGLPAEGVDAAIDALAGIGYAVSVDQRPARLVLVGDEGKVDLHPIVWGPTGAGIQTGFDGETFEYPPGSLEAEGLIAGQPVRCGTPSCRWPSMSGTCRAITIGPTWQRSVRSLDWRCLPLIASDLDHRGPVMVRYASGCGPVAQR